MRAVKRDARRCAARSIDVHDRPWDINVPKSHFYELILQDRHPNTISKLSAKYQFCAISTADTRDGKLTTRGVYPWVVHRLSIVCPPFVHRLYPPITDAFVTFPFAYVDDGCVLELLRNSPAVPDIVE